MQIIFGLQWYADTSAARPRTLETDFGSGVGDALNSKDTEILGSFDSGSFKRYSIEDASALEMKKCIPKHAQRQQPILSGLYTRLPG